MKKSTILALGAVALFGAYILQRKREGNHNERIEGIDVNINPELLVDTTLGSIPMSPLKKELLRSGMKKIIRSYNPAE